MAADFIDTIRYIIGDGTTPVISVDDEGNVTATNSDSVWAQVTVLKKQVELKSAIVSTDYSNAITLQTDATDKLDNVITLSDDIEANIVSINNMYTEMFGEDGSGGTIGAFQAIITPQIDNITNVGYDLDGKTVSGISYTDGVSKIFVVGEDLNKGTNSAISEVASDLKAVDSAIKKIKANIAILEEIGADLAKIGTNPSNLETYSHLKNAVTNAITATNKVVLASQWAESGENVEVEPGNYSAKHHSIKAAGYATNASTSANASATSATASAGSATASLGYANDSKAYRDEIKNVSATASTLTEGSSATASYSSSTGTLTLGIPKGDTGDKGDPFRIDQTGTLEGRNEFDDEYKGFTYLDTDAGNVYFKNTSAYADWSSPLPFGKGDTGDTGVGIASIVFLSTTSTSGIASEPGGVDTYRITYTNGATQTYSVANGDSTVEEVTKLVEVTGTTILNRYDKILATKNIVASSVDGLFTTIRYEGDDDNSVYYRDVLEMDESGNLLEVKHYYNTVNLDVTSGTTTLTHVEGAPIPNTSYTE